MERAFRPANICMEAGGFVRVRTFLPALRAWSFPTSYPRLTPWALVLRRFAAKTNGRCSSLKPLARLD